MSTSRNPRHRKQSSATAARAMAVRAAAIGAVAMPGAAALNAHESGRPASVLAQPLRQTQAEFQAEEQEHADLATLAQSAELEQKSELAAVARPASVAKPVKKTAATPAYTVREGDTLSGIAEHALGSAGRYQEIFALNKDRRQPDGERFTDPSLIKPGWTLTLPAGAKVERAKSARTHTHTSASASASASRSASVTVSSQHTHSASASSVDTGSALAVPSGKTSGTLKDWINDAIIILRASGDDVSYDAVYETAMHESGGDPDAVNGTDSNAAEGHPSIGLMQTIQSTFDAYALPGHRDIYNPVDNIIAAARYAAAVYGSLDEMVEARCDGSCWRGY